jgi:hypothetical protein
MGKGQFFQRGERGDFWDKSFFGSGYAGSEYQIASFRLTPKHEE